MKLLILVMLVLVMTSVNCMSEKDYCRNKLKCINWKQEFDRCRKICTAGVNQFSIGSVLRKLMVKKNQS